MTWEGLSPPYSTIVADPPWAYNVKNPTIRVGHRPAGAATHYSSMTGAEILALPVGDLAAENAHCYLWATNPRLFGGRHDPISPADILDAWGFRYVTLLTWHKLGNLGMGFYFRGETEHVLFGVKGSAPIDVAKRERNWFEAVKTGHSVKPPSFFDLVERVSPGPYVELFCREPRFGWDSWGHGYESNTQQTQETTP